MATFIDTAVHHLGPHHGLELSKPVQPVHDRHDVVAVQQVSAICERAQLPVDTGQQALKKLS